MSQYLKLFALLGCLFCISAIKAATEKNLLRLEADMLKYMETKEREKFFSVTDQLKEESKEAGNEQLFYKAWGNQGIYEAAQQYYQNALDIAKEMKEYALKDGSIYGEYAAMHTEAMILLQKQDYEAAEKSFLNAVDFSHRRFPNESAAEDLRELMKIAYIRDDIAMAKNYAHQLLSEPNVAPHHKGRTLSRLSIMAFDENNVEEFNHIYEEMKRLMQTHQIRTISLYTEVNYHIINGDYKQALLLVDRLSADTCAERKALIYHRLGNNEKAYEYMVQYKHLSDSIARASHENSMASIYLRMNNDRLRLEQELLAQQNSQLRYRYYISIAVFVIMLLLFMVIKRRRIIKLLKRDNSILNYGKKGVERALKDLNELSFYESKTDLPLNMAVKVNKLCDHLANVTQVHCNKNVVTVFQTDFADDFEITTNSGALEKLLSHLLNSSSNFTHKGTIVLRCTEEGEFVMFSITDTSKVLADRSTGQSAGISEDNEDTTRYISMNLNICQSISRLLHGRLWHDIEYTEGTRFYFKIPKQPATSSPNTIQLIAQTTNRKERKESSIWTRKESPLQDDSREGS